MPNLIGRSIFISDVRFSDNLASLMNVLTGLNDLQSVIDVLPSPVFVKNRHHQMVLLNTAACTLFGHAREVLLSSSDADLFPPEQVKVFHDADNRVFDGAAEDENEEEITDAAGVVMSAITRKRAIRLGGEDYLVGVVTDVTARREAEAQNEYGKHWSRDCTGTRGWDDPYAGGPSPGCRSRSVPGQKRGTEPPLQGASVCARSRNLERYLSGCCQTNRTLVR